MAPNYKESFTYSNFDKTLVTKSKEVFGDGSN